MAKKYRWKVAEVDTFMGSAIVYAMDESGQIDVCSCNFEVDRGEASFPNQLRHHIVKTTEAGKKLKPLPHSALDSEVLLLIGREATPKMVVATLRRLSAHIKAAGLAISTTDEGMREGWDGDVWQADVCREQRPSES